MLHLVLIALVAIQTAPTPQIDCGDADHAAFDFWLGDWEVRPTGAETVVAHSTISRTAGGCAIEENYRQTIGPNGQPASYEGRSFSLFDPAIGRWRQFYVDSGGLVTHFEGEAADGTMVFQGPGQRPGVSRRMTLARQPDGSVRQFGEVSSDGGQTWSAGGYDFTYRKPPT